MTSTTTATTDQLSDAFKRCLERKGVMGKLRASLRSELFACLRATDQETRREVSPSMEDKASGRLLKMKPVPVENEIIDQLFVEYLEFNKYFYTLSTFQAELSNNEDILKENNKAQWRESGYVCTGSPDLKVPTIYSIVATRSDKTRTYPT